MVVGPHGPPDQKSVLGSEWGPMVDHGSTGPIRSGPRLAHHPNTLKPRGMSEEEEIFFLSTTLVGPHGPPDQRSGPVKG